MATKPKPELDNRYYIDLIDYRISVLEGEPSDFRMVIHPDTHNPYFVSSSFTGKCEDINWKKVNYLI